MSSVIGAKGEQLMAEGEAAMKKAGGFFGGLFGTSTDALEDAGDKFNRAGNAFKASKRWSEAARAYQKAATCFTKAKADSEASTSYIECARAYIKAGDSKAGTEILESEVLPRVVDSGRLTQAAKLHGELAQMLEEDSQWAEAIKQYQSSADYYTAENAPTTALKALAKVAELSAKIDPPDWATAAETYTKCATESLPSNLLKFNVKNYLFNALLCTLASGDIVAADRDLARYKDLDYTFPGSRECKLLEDVVQAFKDLNLAAFTDALIGFDTISKLDPWRTQVLIVVRNHIKKAGGEGGGGGGAGGGEVDLT